MPVRYRGLRVRLATGCVGGLSTHLKSLGAVGMRTFYVLSDT